MKTTEASEELPAVGERVVYAPQINLKGIVVRHDTRGKETRIVVRFDTGVEGTVSANSLSSEVAK